jgi:hypothetical protein
MKNTSEPQKIVIIDPFIFLYLRSYFDKECHNSEDPSHQTNSELGKNDVIMFGYNYFERLLAYDTNTIFLMSDLMKALFITWEPPAPPIYKMDKSEALDIYINKLKEEGIRIYPMETYQADRAFTDILRKYMPRCLSRLTLQFEPLYMYSGALMYRASEIIFSVPEDADYINRIRVSTDLESIHVAEELCDLAGLQKRDELPSAVCFK